MIFSRKFLILLLLGALPFLFKDFSVFFLYLGIFYNLLIFTLSFFDYFLSPDPEKIYLLREYRQSFSIGHSNLIAIKLRNYSRHRLRMVIKDEIPSAFGRDRNMLDVQMPAFSSKVVQYCLTPFRRGNFTFGAVNFRFWGIWGLAIKQSRRFIKDDRIFVYPDISLAKKYVLFQRKTIAAPHGLRRLKFRGEGTDFESLRDYVPDDDIRWINWKATAKMRKPICKNFQIERSQFVFILIDCGRTMASEINFKSRLDYVVNFAASLSYLALEVGDKVGIIAFSDKIKKFLPPQRSRRHFGCIMDAIYNLKTDMIDSDFGKLFSYFSLKQRRRSLVLLFTELEGGTSSDILISHIRRFSRVHLPLITTIRDSKLLNTSEGPVDGEAGFFRKGIASGLLLEREKTLRALVRQGAVILDLVPESLSLPVLNKYLEIKTKVKL